MRDGKVSSYHNTGKQTNRTLITDWTGTPALRRTTEILKPTFQSFANKLLEQAECSRKSASTA